MSNMEHEDRPSEEEMNRKQLVLATETGVSQKPDILLASFGGQAEVPVPPLPGREPAPNRNPFGGIRGKVAAALATVGLVAGGAGAAYVATQNGEGDDGDNRGVVLNIDTPTSQATEKVETPTAQQSATVESTKTP